MIAGIIALVGMVVIILLVIPYGINVLFKEFVYSSEEDDG